MKKLIFILAITSLLFSSCGDPKPDDSKATFQVSAQNKQHYVPTYDAAGSINGQKAVDDSVAIIKPTWGQAIYYSSESGDTIFKILGTLCLLALGFVIFKLAQPKNGVTLSLGTGALMVGLLSGFLSGWWGKAASIKGNNTKEIPVEQYRSAVKSSGDSKPLWDSLYTSNHLNWAASK